MNNESKEFKKILKEKLDNGISLAKAKFEAVKALGGDFDEKLIASPNNILGLEYTKALLSEKSDIKIYPMLRDGDHNDKTLKKGITSATSIREVVKTGKKKKLKSCIHNYVFSDICSYPFDFEKLCLSALITANTKDMAKILDCTEGLENRIKALLKDNLSLDQLVDKVSTKRYTKTRIQRIILSNLLAIKSELVFDCLDSPLYAKILAVNSQSKDLLTLVGNNSSFPVITRKSDEGLLKKTALSCFEKDILATELFSLITDKKLNHHQMIIVKVLYKKLKE